MTNKTNPNKTPKKESEKLEPSYMGSDNREFFKSDDDISLKQLRTKLHARIDFIKKKHKESEEYPCDHYWIGAEYEVRELCKDLTGCDEHE
jgi:hypothetical protein